MAELVLALIVTVHHGLQVFLPGFWGVWSPETWPWAVRDHTAQVCSLTNNAIGTQLREWGALSRWVGCALRSDGAQVVF